MDSADMPDRNDEDDAQTLVTDELLSSPITAKVLIVDDDARSLYALEGVLSENHVQVITARTGDEALKHLLDHDLALILMDVRMPGMDGYEVASVIRKRKKTRHIPIIFLTGIDKDDVHMFRGYSAGAVDYVFKPVDPMVLKSKVNVFVELFRKSEEVRREERLKRLLQAENFRFRNEKLEAEHALRMSEERQSLILNSLPIALYAKEYDRDDLGPQFLSDRIEHVTGFPPQLFRESPDFWLKRVHPDDRDRVLRDVREIGTQGAFATDYRWCCADDTYRYFYDRAVVVAPGQGASPEIFGMWLDVTEHRQLEEQLAQSTKLRAIGQLTGGIAHDFNNMLTSVMGYLDLLRRQLDPDSKAARQAEMAVQSAIRCADLTQRLLYFARQKELRQEVADVKHVVGGMTQLLHQTLPDSIEVEVRMEDGLWPVTTDRSQLESSLLNLVINARDALIEGGTVVIEGANVTLDEPHDDGVFKAEAGDYVRLSVVDNGTGMPPEVLDRLFEPFFTTKEPGHGTGLGLSMIYTFAQQGDGFIRIESEVGHGTSVHLYLQRADAPAEAVSQSSDPTEPLPAAQGEECILVTEDDETVLAAAAETLRALGYHVLEAKSGVAAREILSAAEHKVDLLFTDIAMPGGVSGRDLAHWAVARFPDLHVLFTSGYTDRIESADGSKVAAELLSKPYRDYELARAVRKVLDAAPAAGGPSAANP